jgi:hypothetical protein
LLQGGQGQASELGWKSRRKIHFGIALEIFGEDARIASHNDGLLVLSGLFTTFSRPGAS